MQSRYSQISPPNQGDELTFTIYSPEVSRTIAKQPYRFVLAALGGLLGSIVLVRLALRLLFVLSMPDWMANLVVLFGGPILLLGLFIACIRYLRRQEDTHTGGL